MDTGITTKKTNRGTLLNQVDKKQNGDKKCRNETKKNYFKPNKQIRNPTNQSIYKREKDGYIKHPSCRSKKVYFQETTLPNR